MLSSRRLAREWALKILYQVDVGKSTVADAEDLALERLRREFVQRGSRTASGSRAEEMALDCLTRDLRDTLPGLRPPLERALASAAGRVMCEVPCWQESRFERSFRSRAPAIPLVPPHLLETQLYDPVRHGANDPSATAAATDALAPDESARTRQFVRSAAESLPRVLDPELRRIGLAFAKELVANRPVGAAAAEQEDWLLKRRLEFNACQTERWRKIGAIVQKQTSDWLRTAAFTVKLVSGTLERQSEIDSSLGELASGWRMERQVSVDRNILRLAAFEMLFVPGIPTGASINEAVELAKKYSTAESGRFVNGVLGALAATIADRSPAGETDSPDAEGPDPALDLPDIIDIEDTDTE